MIDTLKDMKWLHIGRQKLSKENFIKPINKRFFPKPIGGLWVSPYNEDSLYKSAWREFAIDMNLSIYNKNEVNIGTIITLKPEARVYIINSFYDLKNLIKSYSDPRVTVDEYFRTEYPNYEKISEYYDMIFLTEKGEKETRLPLDCNLYGWDVESAIILNYDIIEYQRGIEMPKIIGDNNIEEENESNFEERLKAFLDTLQI